MADVFISYAGEDRESAHKLADALEAEGFSVWWDRKIVPGQSFDEVIEQALAAAKCVIVLWSRNSVGSEWVRNEAADGAARGVLVPALIEDVNLPLEFRRKQTADLVGWNGNAAHQGFSKLSEGVAEKTSRISSGLRPPPPTPATSFRRLRILALGTAVAAVALALFISLRWPGSQTFYAPMFEGMRLDACFEWANRCGEEAASAWCKTQGFSRATMFPIESVGERGITTRLIGTRQVCKETFCASFSHITCTR